MYLQLKSLRPWSGSGEQLAAPGSWCTGPAPEPAQDRPASPSRGQPPAPCDPWVAGPRSWGPPPPLRDRGRRREGRAGSPARPEPHLAGREPWLQTRGPEGAGARSSSGEATCGEPRRRGRHRPLQEAGWARRSPDTSHDPAARRLPAPPRCVSESEIGALGLQGKGLGVAPAGVPGLGIGARRDSSPTGFPPATGSQPSALPERGIWRKHLLPGLEPGSQCPTPQH